MESKWTPDIEKMQPIVTKKKEGHEGNPIRGEEKRNVDPKNANLKMEKSKKRNVIKVISSRMKDCQLKVEKKVGH